MRWEILILAAIVAVSGCVDADQNSSPEQENNVDNSAPTNETSSPTDKDSGDTNTIYYTSSGFQPSDITIQQGETVTWINNASTSMWIASDRHPSHTHYAGSTRSEHCQNGDQTSDAFDQCSSGEQFSFTFEKTGEWDYHNHERAAHGGTVTVE